MNLEVGTWHQTEITEQWIGGPLVELLRLATLIALRANLLSVQKQVLQDEIEGIKRRPAES